ncbi:hypothetical protein [Nodosilinea nodulosa]|uniref:hypothetical protein n=1 Tax=Nodosilinea nodulosa TaxID=416001 RepID=UPI0012D77D43|nr:hypothetical protein [Nodosilinea nodulosa]
MVREAARVAPGPVGQRDRHTPQPTVAEHFPLEMLGDRRTMAPPEAPYPSLGRFAPPLGTVPTVTRP